MAGIAPEAITDLIRSTLPSLPVRGEFESAMSKQTYPFLSYVFKNKRRRRQSGTNVSMRVQLTQSGLARMVSLYEPTPNTVQDNLSEITAPWSFAERKAHWDRKEFEMNKGPAEIVDLLKSRRVDAARDLVDLLEDQCWGVPESAADNKNTRGVPYWINFANDGVESFKPVFAGQTVRYGDGSTGTLVGGIDKADATLSNWRNLVATYTNFNPSVLQQLRMMMRRMNFRVPSEVKSKLSGYGAPQFCIYTDLDIADEYEAMVNAGPDDRNGDLSPFNGDLAYKRVMWQATSALDGQAEAPIYLLDHERFYPVVMEWMRESDPVRDRSQIDTWTVAMTCWYQVVCNNCRAGGGVIHKPIAA